MIKGFAKTKAAHLRLGKRGENAACKLLKAKNMDVLVRNFKRKQGEIDIIARDGKALCFVEVKTRMSHSRIRPAENLSTRQKKRIAKSAMGYLSEIGNPKVVYRFDLIEVIYSQWNLQEICYWPNYFTKKQS